MSLINVHMHARLLLYTGQWFSGGGPVRRVRLGGSVTLPWLEGVGVKPWENDFILFFPAWQLVTHFLRIG